MKTFDFILIIICLVIGGQGHAQTFRYFDVKTLKYTAILIPKNHVLLPVRQANEYNMYGIKKPAEVKNEYKKRLKIVFPQPDTTLIKLLDSIAYKSVFRNDLKIYYGEYKVPLKALPRIQKIEDKLFQFFEETQTIRLKDYLIIDSTRFEESNLTIFKLGKLFK